MKCNWNTVFVLNGREILPARTGEEAAAFLPAAQEEELNFKQNTISYKILQGHNTSGNMDKLRLRFNALASHDITYVGIVQTARASGLKEFPVPYALTNCHNSLCAVGGTMNEDDHLFGLSAAHKYGGIYVPAHVAVIHSYVREELARAGEMILGSDSHTRYGALGTMAIGEGGPELVKQLLKKTYDVNYPEIIAVYLTNAPKPGVGPHDVALALIKEVFAAGKVKNKVLEFVGPGIASLSVDFRNGIDVMTTETACLSSIWMTDNAVKEYYITHGRPDAFIELAPAGVAQYEGLIEIDLSAIEPMIALPFHPSNAYSIKEFLQNAGDLLHGIEEETKKQFGLQSNLSAKLRNGKFFADQGVIAGCAGGIYENICAAADLLEGKSTGSGAFSLSVYPSSQSVYMEMLQGGTAETLTAAGAILKTAFCGPCFGAGDVPANNAFSIRHTTRNFPNREGSKPGEGQVAFVALMDARSIAATAANGGKLTAATEMEPARKIIPPYHYHGELYKKRVYNGVGKPEPETGLVFGPNIADWPALPEMSGHLLLRLCAVINDPVTTTDELIPSGETSTLRSNPYKLSEFTLSRKEPAYVGRAKAVAKDNLARTLQNGDVSEDLAQTLKVLKDNGVDLPENSCLLGSALYATMPGDGSAREQAASCQKVLGGWANIAVEYATKRYRSNLVNWGLVPLLIDPAEGGRLQNGDYVLLYGVRDAILADKPCAAYVVSNGKCRKTELGIVPLTPEEKQILTAGGLINHYKQQR